VDSVLGQLAQKQSPLSFACSQVQNANNDALIGRYGATGGGHLLAVSFCGRNWLKKAAVPGLLVAGLLLAMIVINPFREMVSDDDGWAYARSVQHLVTTGKYQLDPWSAANMPVQIYLAAGLSKLAGYSLRLLRFTTLALLVVGLGSLYALLREISSTRNVASVLTLGLLASPLVLMLTFSFMSDIQFLGWLLLSLWLYVRAMRNKSAGGMFLAARGTSSGFPASRAM
jgi:Dolichyl-phosphate-mannose-protein mannosyltransferase